jgi:hypothetical protein
MAKTIFVLFFLLCNIFSAGNDFAGPENDKCKIGPFLKCNQEMQHLLEVEQQKECNTYVLVEQQKECSYLF